MKENIGHGGFNNIGDKNRLTRGQISLETIFDVAPSSMLIVDDKRIIKKANGFFLDSFHMSHDEVVNMSIGQVFGCKNIDGKKSCGWEINSCRECPLKQTLDRVIEGLDTIKGLEFKKTIISRDYEKEHYFKINATPLSIGFDRYAIVVLEDITRYKKFKKDLLKYQLLSQNANDIILFADIDGNVIEANQAAINVFGYAKEKILGKQIFYLVSPNPKQPIEIQSHQANTEGIYYEAIAYRKDGSTFTAEVSLQGTEIEENKIFMAILRDTTERMEITQELKKAKEAAEAANQAKSEFLANMSHEIRTPLNGMLGMIDLTLLTMLSKEQRDNLLVAKECASNLLKLINDILDFSKIEAGKLRVEKVSFDIRKTIKNTVKPHELRAEKKGLEFQHAIDDNIPTMVKGDPYRLKQVINNLLNNAIKFTDFGRVDLDVKLLARRENLVELQFRVSDTGIGIKSEDISHLFESFSQVDSSYTRKYGGTGLGLTISKELIEKMKGSIWVESREGQGSTFYFTVKFTEGNTLVDQQRKINAIKESEKSFKILLVEDDRVNQMVMARMLKEAGHKIYLAANGLEALDIFNKKEIDIILMDIQMPEMDGLETTKRIRKIEASRGVHTPIIAITAYALQGDREKFLSTGMDDYISKPIQMESFLETVEKIVEECNSKTNCSQAHRNRIKKEKTIKAIKGHVKREDDLLEKMYHAMEELDSLLKRGSLTIIENYARKIKNLSSELGLREVRVLMFKIELAIRRENLSEAKTYFNEVKVKLADYEGKIKT